LPGLKCGVNPQPFLGRSDCQSLDSNFQIKFPVESMARPKAPPTELRSVKFTIRLTISEQQKLVQLSEVCGKAPTVLTREKLFKGRFPQPKMAKLDLNYYLELKKIGVNLNQLTRLANGGRIPRELLPLLMQLYNRLELTIDKIVYDSNSENR
jgi:hypothetical protein